MPLKDVVIAALSRPAGRVVEAPVRDLIDEALKDRGYASPAEIARLEGELGSLRAQIQGLPAKLSALEAEIARVSGEAAALREALGRAEAAATEAREKAEQAEARAAEAERRLSELSSATPAVSAGPSPCKVEGCARRAAERGFCRPHLLAWKAGRLPGFVSPEGLLALGSGAGRVPLALAGEPYREQGGQVLVAGQPVSVRAL